MFPSMQPLNSENLSQKFHRRSFNIAEAMAQNIQKLRCVETQVTFSKEMLLWAKFEVMLEFFRKLSREVQNKLE